MSSPPSGLLLDRSQQRPQFGPVQVHLLVTSGGSDDTVTMVEIMVLPGATDLQEPAEESSDGPSGTLRLHVVAHADDLNFGQSLGISREAGRTFAHQGRHPCRVLVTVSSVVAGQGLLRAARQTLTSAQAGSGAPRSISGRSQGPAHLISESSRRTAA